jgi:hypothetical protein
MAAPLPAAFPERADDLGGRLGTDARIARILRQGSGQIEKVLRRDVQRGRELGDDVVGSGIAAIPLDVVQVLRGNGLAVLLPRDAGRKVLLAFALRWLTM